MRNEKLTEVSVSYCFPGIVFLLVMIGSQCSANFQPILDCFMSKFKLKYDDVENIKQIVLIQSFSTYTKSKSFFVLGHPVLI